MTNSSKIKQLQADLDELRQIKDMFYRLEDRVMSIETAASKIEESLPSDETLTMMEDGLQKEQMLKILELAKDVYTLVDEMLGPPDQQQCDEALSPQARGNDGLSLEAAIYKFMPGGKNPAS